LTPSWPGRALQGPPGAEHEPQRDASPSRGQMGLAPAQGLLGHHHQPGPKPRSGKLRACSPGDFRRSLRLPGHGLFSKNRFFQRGFGPFPWLNPKDGQIIIALPATAETGFCLPTWPISAVSNGNRVLSLKGKSPRRAAKPKEWLKAPSPRGRGPG
jgi:hypothetical protein